MEDDAANGPERIRTRLLATAPARGLSLSL